MLHLHRAERADRLADALAEVLLEPGGDPFAPELVAVPTRGMERWLTQRLSARLGASPGAEDGVCANVDFPFPGRLVSEALAAASGIEPDADPWPPERLAWRLRQVVTACREEPWLAPLVEHLATAPEYELARLRSIAGLFDAYAVRRPALILDWAAGGETGGGWQPELWRRLRQAVGVPSSAERLAPACAALRADPGLVELPSRIALFGLTRLPPSLVDALHALALGREVHLFLLHPSPELWSRVAEEVVARAPLPPERATDPTAALPRNRLLASWGRDSRELQLVLAGGASRAALASGAAPLLAEHHHAPASEPTPTLLRRLQADIHADRASPGGPLRDGDPDRRALLAVEDDSVRVHACHGRQRQVEVLREAILHRLATDPTLEPRDVIVMCPDIETFAPLIGAVFGSAPEDPATVDDGGASAVQRIDLRVRLADRSLRGTNPLLAAVSRLLELAGSRLTASELLDLIDSAPIRRRFGLDDDDISRVREWTRAAAIHWGLDAEHRGRFRLEAVEAGTWALGLRRLLLGVTMSEAELRLFEGVLPLDDVESGAIDLAGRLSELLDRLATAIDRLAGPQTLRAWADAILSASDSLCGVAAREAWQRLELAGVLEGVLSEAGSAANTVSLSRADVRSLLAERLAGRPTRANFRTGHLTVCTLVPMRSVPHRVVCLLGLDDGEFPRRTPCDGDDLLLVDPWVGDRDPRAEDRQLLLDALLAAEEALIVTYSGADERTNAARPPAVPVGELLDAVEATVRCPDGGSARERICLHHPLQPFDPRNFRPGTLVPGEAWSYDAGALAGAEVLESGRREIVPFLPAGALPVLDEGGALALSDLIGFVERPVRAFLRQRLRIPTGTGEDDVDDDLPVELDGLERWAIGQRLLNALLAGADFATAMRAEIARGTLPPEALGKPVFERVRDEAAPIVQVARAEAGPDAVSRQTNVRLLDGTQLTGTVSGIRGDVLLSASFSRLTARDRIRSWVRLLALTAAHPELPLSAVTVGRRRAGVSGVAVTLARIAPLGRDADTRRATALRELGLIADLRARGLREPLPLPCLSAAAYAAAAMVGGQGGDAVQAAEREWRSEWNWPKEDAEPDHVRAFGEGVSLAELMAIAPSSDELGDGWAATETSRFGRLAVRLWEPLLAREAVEDL